MSLEEILRIKRDEILAIAARHGASNVRVFGSLARGEGSADSDLDLLVVFEPDRSMLDHSRLILDLEELLGCKVDVVTEQSLHWSIRAAVLKDATAL